MLLSLTLRPDSHAPHCRHVASRVGHNGEALSRTVTNEPQSEYAHLRAPQNIIAPRRAASRIPLPPLALAPRAMLIATRYRYRDDSRAQRQSARYYQTPYECASRLSVHVQEYGPFSCVSCVLSYHMLSFSDIRFGLISYS